MKRIIFQQHNKTRNITAIFNPKFIWISYSNLKKSLSKSVDNIFPVATTGSLDFSNFEKD
jgi:hypothetical protein